MTGENGITRQSVQQQLISNPQLAQELGAFFAAERSTTLQTKSLGTFTVDGQNNGVLYGRLGSRDVNERMAGNIDMVPGNIYRLDADGSIDKNGWWFGGDVSPTDSQEGRSGSRLQVAVVDSSGNVIDRQNYRPGMEISTDVEGARLGFIFADGDLGDNSGQFNVNVRETSATAQATNVGIIAADADGIDRAGRTIVDAFEAAPAAASLPEPDPRLSHAPAERGLLVDRQNDVIETTDGYRFSFHDNEVRIDWPGRTDDGSPETRINGRNVTEGDGTTWTAENGNYVLPNGALFTLGYDENNIRRFTLVHGDSRVDVDGIGGGDPRVRSVQSGGIDYRRRVVEDNFGGNTFRMGGHNDGWSDLDIAWNLERGGRNVGRLEDGNWILRGAPYVVDPELKPQFGTQDYERMLRAEIEDVRSAISGSAMANGSSRDYGRLLGDHILAQDGTYDAYAQEMQASAASRGGDPSAYFQQLLEQMWLEQMLGGIPEYHGNFDNAMSSVQMLQQLLAAQAGLQNEMAGGFNPAQTFIPNWQQQQVDPSMLIDQVLRGLGERSTRSPQRSRLDRFDIGGDRRARGTFDNDPHAALLRNRLTDAEPSQLSNPRQTVEELKDKLSYGAFDWAVTDGEAHDVISRLASMNDRDLRDVAEQLGPDMIHRLLDNLSDEDKTSFKDTIERLQDVGNAPRITLDDAGETPKGVADELKDKLSYGAFDWAVTNEEARSVIDRLSRYDEQDLQAIATEMGPDMISRLVDNLSDEDKTHYAETVGRLNQARNNRREDVADVAGTAEELKGKMEYGAFDWAVTDGESREVIDRLSRMGTADMLRVAEQMGPEALTRLEQNLSDADKTAYADTLQRLREVRNAPRETLTNPREVVNEIEGKLSYGAFDWAVTDGEARDVVNILSRYNDRDLRRVVEMIDPELLNRLESNLTDADKTAFASTLARIGRVR